MKLLILLAVWSSALATPREQDDPSVQVTRRQKYADPDYYYPRLVFWPTPRPFLEARIDVACLDPKEAGPCKAAFPRFYYNVTTKTCELFIYSGCGGNRNNFKTIEECRNRCQYAPGPTTPTENASSYTEPISKESETGWPNQIQDVEGRVDIACLEMKYPGPCKGYFPRYYFNIITNTCEEFIYGGCQSNGNNFKTIEECRNRCRYVGVRPYGEDGLPTEVPEVSAAVHQQYQRLPYQEEGISAPVDATCQMSHDRGPCKGYIKRYYYSSAKKACKQFMYGGCQGNGNNFRTLQECRNRCSPALSQEQIVTPEAYYVQLWPFVPPEMCTHLPESGPCRAPIQRRYFYDTLTNSCEQFIYGGCGGNKNNFYSVTECEEKCKKFMGVIPRA